MTARELFAFYAVISFVAGVIGIASALAGLLALATWARAAGRGLEGVRA